MGLLLQRPLTIALELTFLGSLLCTCHRVEKPPMPAGFGPASNQQLASRFGCIKVVDISENDVTFKILVVCDGESEYQVGCYRLKDHSLVLSGTPINLLKFSLPTIESQPRPRLATKHLASGDAFYFQLLPSFELLPEAGGWQPVDRPARRTPEGGV